MREAKIFVIVGGRGSGKTYFLENNLNLLKNKTIVIELFFTDRYKNFKKILFQDFLNSNIENYKNLNLIIDDASQLVNSQPIELIKKIIISSKQLNTDVFFCFHSFNFIPNFLYYLTDYYIIFKTNDNEINLKNTPLKDEIIKKINSVKKKKKFFYEILENY